MGRIGLEMTQDMHFSVGDALQYHVPPCVTVLYCGGVQDENPFNFVESIL